MSDRLLRWREAVDGDGAGLGAAIETDAAASAAFAGVVRRVNAVRVQLGQKFEALGRAGLDAESAAFAFLGIDEDVATRGPAILTSLGITGSGTLQPLGFFAILSKAASRNLG